MSWSLMISSARSAPYPAWLWARQRLSPRFRTIAVEGQYSNNATATGKTPDESEVSDTDPDYYFGLAPGISLVKKTNGVDSNTAPGQNIPVGSPVTWSYEVKNTGNVVLTNVVVTDDKLGQIGIIASLAVGETKTLTKLPGPIAVEGQYSNIGTATGKTPDKS